MAQVSRADPIQYGSCPRVCYSLCFYLVIMWEVFCSHCLFHSHNKPVAHIFKEHFIPYSEAKHSCHTSCYSQSWLPVDCGNSENEQLQVLPPTSAGRVLSCLCTSGRWFFLTQGPAVNCSCPGVRGLRHRRLGGKAMRRPQTRSVRSCGTLDTPPRLRSWGSPGAPLLGKSCYYPSG